VGLDPASVETNIVIFGFEHPKFTVPAFLDELHRRGVQVLAAPGGNGIRMVTHKDVDDADVDRALEAFREILS
jgi:threonine aldolase